MLLSIGQGHLASAMTLLDFMLIFRLQNHLIQKKSIDILC